VVHRRPAIIKKKKQATLYITALHNYTGKKMPGDISPSYPLHQEQGPMVWANFLDWGRPGAPLVLVQEAGRYPAISTPPASWMGNFTPGRSTIYIFWHYFNKLYTNSKNSTNGM
jgi:hypothetical protein